MRDILLPSCRANRKALLAKAAYPMYEIWFSHGRRFVKCRKLNIWLKHTHTHRILWNVQWSNGYTMCGCLCEIEHVHSAVIKRISNNVRLSRLHSMQQLLVHSRCGRLYWVPVWCVLLLLLCWDICRHRASIAMSVVRCVHAKQNTHSHSHTLLSDCRTTFHITKWCFKYLHATDRVKCWLFENKAIQCVRS